jgi:hypothetical protein
MSERLYARDKGTSTPWGKAQLSDKSAPGIIFYVTAGHGGYHLSEGRMAQLPKEIKDYIGGNYDWQRGWFEEDCDWAMVVYSFPEYFDLTLLADAYRSLRQWKPELYKTLQFAEVNSQ